ncbi:propionate catabolism operon transcriptional regulator [Panacagrimonas perspica]|uniref:Propionate catabolism operon transcriptional regulator n=1 Tax=Panacagrimonas perspica TaxID=381431 RepID=A0A4R7P3P1_9GAMM|nr:propionate catabolism operon regulatory protein PrpR [Panacagrimonas perspica]TDU28393.1 propionate catabolism operon transcriptional regulator [Panacagrimonas perspica]THD01192.1 propionate catabolism operon regulatory protein PrpR [Panacagrimonas perspica]
MKRRNDSYVADDSGGSAHRPVIWTVSVSRLSRLLQDVTPEFDTRARIENIHLGFDEAVTTLRGRMQRERCDVLIAAGSNGAYLKNRLDKPVVLVRPDGFDLMLALAQAHRISPNIGVLTHQTEVPAFDDFQKSFGLDIAQRAFETAEDARTQVRELVALGCTAIVGTGLAADLAEQAGVAGILLYSADTIRQAFESALEIARAVGSAETQAPSLRAGRGSGGGRYALSDLIGDSAVMRALRHDIVNFATSDRTVLISGDTGTGKELVAQSLHAGSPRRKGAFVAVNCGAIAESLLESELFGYEEGAFTGSRRGGRTGLMETAHGGTLFLDEIGEMPLALQTRLLRALEEREVLRVGASRAVPIDIRVIAATHGNLDAMAAAGRFRRDLYYRLNVLRLQVPKLIERGADIVQLARHFLEASLGEAAPEWTEAALDVLRAHAWPGNVRELRNLVDRVAVFCEGSTAPIDVALLRRCAPELLGGSHHSEDARLTPSPEAEPKTSAARRRSSGPRPDLRRVMERAGGDRQVAARILGVSRTTLWRWLRDAKL